MTTPLKTGDKVPSLKLPVTGGGEIDLSSPTDRMRVIFFYPKDSTPGCTTEAQDFSRLKDEFAKIGADIVGVSRDSLASHEKFLTKKELTIPLASDEADGAATEAFGVWVEKAMYGKTYMGIERSTFLIAKDATILEAWRKVRVKGHVNAVLEAATNQK